MQSDYFETYPIIWQDTPIYTYDELLNSDKQFTTEDRGKKEYMDDVSYLLPFKTSSDRITAFAKKITTLKATWASELQTEFGIFVPELKLDVLP